MSWDRVILVGEDQAHREFLEGVCANLGWRVSQRHFAPKGKGDASDWVLGQLPERLQELQYPGLGLVVAVDGDNKGRAKRLNQITQKCADHDLPPLGSTIPVAILVPTWSIDTWALFFHKGRIISEAKASKLKAKNLFTQKPPGMEADSFTKSWKADPLKKLVEGFLGTQSHPQLPSLDSSRKDLARWRP